MSSRKQRCNFAGSISFWNLKLFASNFEKIAQSSERWGVGDLSLARFGVPWTNTRGVWIWSGWSPDVCHFTRGPLDPLLGAGSANIQWIFGQSSDAGHTALQRYFYRRPVQDSESAWISFDSRWVSQTRTPSQINRHIFSDHTAVMPLAHYMAGTWAARARCFTIWWRI